MANEGKVGLKDRLVSKMKNDAGEELLQKGGLVAGTLYGMKRHNMNLSKALTTTGLMGGAVGTLAGGVGIGATRLKKLHNKELGTNPDKKDYGKVIAANAIPAAIGFGALAKNHDKLEHEANKAINVGKAIVQNKGKGLGQMMMNKAKNLSRGVGENALKGAEGASGKKKLLIGAGTLGLAAATELPNLIINPESIVNKKKREMNELNKTAFEIIDEAFDKIAKEEYDDSTKKKLKENRTTFWHDRAGSSFKDGLAGFATGAVGAGIAGATGHNPVKGFGAGAVIGGVGNSARRLQKLHKEELGENPSAMDYVKNVGTRAVAYSGKGPVGLLALANTPEAIIKAKKRNRIKQEADSTEKSAFEVIDEAFDKIASIYE